MARVFLAIIGAAYLVLAVYAKVIAAGKVRVGDLIRKTNDANSQ